MARTNAATKQQAPAPKNLTNAQALKQRQQQREGESVTVLENAPQFIREDAAVNPADLINDGVEKPPAVDLDTIEDEATRGPAVRRFTVLEGKRVQTSRNGQRTYVHEGKVIDANNYDIALLREQGMKLKEILDEEV